MYISRYDNSANDVQTWITTLLSNYTTQTTYVQLHEPGTTNEAVYQITGYGAYSGGSWFSFNLSLLGGGGTYSVSSVFSVGLIRDGAAGTSGVNGSSGTSGVNGSSGTSGVTGATGSSGTSGVNGSSGTSGVSGSSGTSGVSGSSGTSGVNGSSGTSGVNGSSGTSGVNGSSGTSGAAGAAGSSGTSGISGGGSSAIRILGQTLSTTGWYATGSYYGYTYSSVNIGTASNVEFVPYNDYNFTIMSAKVQPYVLSLSGSAILYSQYVPSSSIVGDFLISTTT
jgi:hypothetical protein